NAIVHGSRVVAQAGPGAILPHGHRAEGQAMKRSPHQLIADGVIGGVLAGLVVALWFLAVDSIAGRPFHTPAALASALTRQAIGPPTFRLVAAYSVVHFGVFGVSALKGHPLLVQGLVTGLVGAGVVALWFFVLDLAAGHPLRTPAALGAALLFGASNVAAVQTNLGLVAAYSVVHVAAFVVAG